jgi:uncharacterized RDD family membrane protein YckC
MSPAELKALPSPRFWRRVFCNLYEQLILLGVLAFTFLVPNLIIGIVFGVAIPSWLTFFYLYGVLALYFTWYWRRSGQTLAMQTWRIQLITEDGYRPEKKQAFWRYVYGSLWLLPCLAIHAAFQLRGWQIISLLFVVALFCWPLTIYIDRKHRQGLPDRMAKTKLVELPRHPNKKVSSDTA